MSKLAVVVWTLGWFPAIAVARYLFIVSQGEPFTAISRASGSVMLAIWFVGLVVFWPWGAK